MDIIFTTLKILLIIFSIYIFVDSNKSLRDKYLSQGSKYIYTGLFSVLILFNPKEHFKKETIKEGYFTFVFSRAMLLLSLALLIL